MHTCMGITTQMKWHPCYCWLQTSPSELDRRDAGDLSGNGRGCACRVSAISETKNLIPAAFDFCICNLMLRCSFSYAAIADQSRPSHLQVTSLVSFFFLHIRVFNEFDFATIFFFFQPELNLPLLTSTHSMPNIRLAKYAKVSTWIKSKYICHQAWT